MKRALIAIMCIVVLAGCQSSPVATEEGKVAQAYLEHQGYTVLSYEGEMTHVYTGKSVEELPDKFIWDVQTRDPEDFIGVPFRLLTFVVKNHPLDDQFGEGETSVTVMMTDKGVMGGWSLPRSKDPLVGGVYSLDGKTANEQ